MNYSFNRIFGWILTVVTTGLGAGIITKIIHKVILESYYDLFYENAHLYNPEISYWTETPLFLIIVLYCIFFINSEMQKEAANQVAKVKFEYERLLAKYEH